jgi:hypothetical protein
LRHKVRTVSIFVDKLVLTLPGDQEETMKTEDLEEIQVEVREELEHGRQKGETEVETMSQILWKERQRRKALLFALEEISRVASAALDREKESLNKTAVVFEWRN